MTFNNIMNLNLTNEPKRTGRSLEDFKDAVAAGLTKKPKTIPPRFFYDNKGSEIFQEITRMPEYYLTGAENEILFEQGSDVITHVCNETYTAGKKLQIIELGAGDSQKPYPLIEALMETAFEFDYTAIDISSGALKNLEKNLMVKYPHLDYHSITGEYFEGLENLTLDAGSCRLVLFLGSNIGNFSPSQQVNFLKNIRNYLNANDLLLIGFDLVKDPDTLLAAYSDPGNITAEFNLNLLERINNELNGNFNIENFFHHAVYNPVLQAMESYIISKIRQSVSIESIGATIEFDEFEPILTEYSFKYTRAKIKNLAQSSGFSSRYAYYDSNQYFTNQLWKAI